MIGVGLVFAASMRGAFGVFVSALAEASMASARRGLSAPVPDTHRWEVWEAGLTSEADSWICTRCESMCTDPPRVVGEDRNCDLCLARSLMER